MASVSNKMSNTTPQLKTRGADDTEIPEAEEDNDAGLVKSQTVASQDKDENFVPR